MFLRSQIKKARYGYFKQLGHAPTQLSQNQVIYQLQKTTLNLFDSTKEIPISEQRGLRGKIGED